jgi:probable rRNA maturation factor
MRVMSRLKEKTVSVEVTNESGTAVSEESLQAITLHAMRQMKVHPDAEVAIVLVDEKSMAELHLQWMDEPGPTDVLSFPMDELRPGLDGHDSVEGILGDIVLCPSVAQKQAQEAGHTLMDELHMLTVHGMLHLLGYDHAEPEEEKEMFGLQAEILSSFAGGV